MNNETQEPKTSKILDPKANMKALTRIVVLIVVLIGGIWLFIRYTAGQGAANRVTSAILHQRIDLVNTTQDLPASSFKALPILLPYAGTLTVDLTVRRGNDISVYVVSPDQIDKIKAKQQFTYFQGFDADKTKIYQRSGRLASGSYYLVMLDKSLGILSQQSSDIQVNAKLEP
jgi:hypothetical protein